MMRLWDRAQIWLKRRLANFGPLPVSEIDFSRIRTESPRIEPGYTQLDAVVFSDSGSASCGDAGGCGE
jgi:hypothetical protein